MRISDWSSDVCSSDLPKNFWHCAISDQGIRRAAAISFQFHLTCVSSLFSFTKLIPARMPIVSHWWLLNSCQVQLRAFWMLADNCFSTVCQNMDGPTSLLVKQRQSPSAGHRTGNGSPIARLPRARPKRSEEHTSELQSLMRISYAVSCLKK